MKSLFKVLSVVIVIACVTFMGVSIAAYFGRAEPMAEARTPEMAQYTFEQSGGTRPTWTVTSRTGEKKNLGTFKNGYEAITKAHKDLTDRLNQESGNLKTEIGKIKAADGQVAAFTASQTMDEKAMQDRITELQQLNAEYEQQLLKKSEELQALSVKSKAIRDETALRRTDVMRLSNELGEARTDVYRLTELKRQLTDLLVRLQIDGNALGERQSQLRDQLGEQ